MANYKVVYETEVDADNPLDAALQVEQQMIDSDYRPYFSITGPDKQETDIDLEEQDVETN